jgi:hypothetical protein
MTRSYPLAFFWVFAFAFSSNFFCNCEEFLLTDIEKRNAADLDAIEAANWALQHLRGMSKDDSYECLRLKEIKSHNFKRGKYHDIIFLKMVLFAPSDQEVGGVAESLLLGGVPTSEHKVTVFTDRRDGVRSFSIDKFPRVRTTHTDRKGTRKTSSTSPIVESEWWPEDFELEEDFDNNDVDASGDVSDDDEKEVEEEEKEDL